MSNVTGKQRLIVGIDYGTTYSGLSFALTGATDFRDINTWTKYPGASSHSAEHYEKAPTRIAFKWENDGMEGDAWGYQVEPGMKTYTWTKLLLDQLAVQSEFDDPDLYLANGENIMKLPEGKCASWVVTEYLKKLKAMFDDAVPLHSVAQTINDLPMDFWITVPASWTEKARLLTIKAAKDAGFGTRDIDTVSLISEPEAAAHAVLKSSLHRLEEFVEPRTGVMVCDCGGGTVDITTYEIEATKPTLKLKESVVGIAGKCGGTFVDRNLYKLMSERFQEAFTSLKPEMTGPGSSFMDLFESRKKDFSTKMVSRWPHRFNLYMADLKTTDEMNTFYDRRSSSVLLTQADYKKLFDPVLEKVEELIENQVQQVKKANKAPIETLVLVGGFGSSPYLKERILVWCERNNIRLRTPVTGGWSAVVRGAVLRGLEGSIVTERKCRKHYGYMVMLSYNESLHANYDKTKRKLSCDPFTNQMQLDGFMNWDIAKGVVMNDETEIMSSWTWTFTNRLPTISTLTLRSCNLDKAPSTIESDRIEEVGQVVFSLEGIDKSTLPQTIKGNKRYYQLNASVHVRLNDERGHLIFFIKYQGNVIGEGEINLENL